MQMKKAFSILELLIVMSVVGAISLLGVLGLLNMQYSIEYNNFYSQIIVYQQSIKNQAINSSSVNQSENKLSADFYAFGIINNQFQNISCNSQISGNSVNCNITNSLNLVIPDYITIEIQPESCNNVAFRRLDAKLFRVDQDEIYDTQTCVINVIHNNLDQARIITFDIQNNEVIKQN